MSTQVRFGVMMPFGPDYQTSRQIAQTAEALGYDSLWVGDHLFSAPGPPDLPWMECWTFLSALAAETRRVRLGTMTLCNGFRAPALLAKMVATLDVISGGRLEVGIGSGWYEKEFLGYGYPFPKASARVRQLDEALQILNLMWTERCITFKGEHYQLIEGYCEPKPVQRPRPPIHFGGDGEKLMLPLVARHADWWNYWLSTNSIEGFRHKLGVLERCCTEIGRDPATLGRSAIGQIMLGETEKELRLLVAEAEKDIHFGGRIGLQGTPAAIIKRIEEYRALGVSLFIVAPTWFAGSDSWRSFLQLFAEQVMIQVR